MYRRLQQNNSVKVTNLFVISGPSGVGKTTAVQALLRKYPHDLTSPLTYTTRKPREGEVHGRDMNFVSRPEWYSLLTGNGFAAVNEIYGNLYGTRLEEISQPLASGKRVVLVLDAKGADDIRRSGLHAAYLYLVPKTLEQLRERLLKRWPLGDPIMNTRLALAEEEMSARFNYDYEVESDDFDTLISDLEELLCLKA